MPLLGMLLKGIFGNVYALILAIQSSHAALRIAAITVLATAYISCVVGFTTFIQPLLSRLFSSNYGQVLGMAFPPIAGTILASFVTIWGCIIAKRYYRWVVTIGVGK